MIRLLQFLTVLGFPATSLMAAATATAPEGSTVLAADGAGDAGLQHLFDVIAGMQVECGGTQSLSAVLAFSPAIEIRFRELLLPGVRRGRPRHTQSGTVAVDVSVSLDSVEQCLKVALRETSSESHSCDVKLVRGSDPVATATGEISIDGRARDARPGWRHCTTEDIVLAKQAAEADLHQRVRALLGRLRLANHQPIAALLREQPKLDASMRAQVARLQAGEAEYNPIGVCLLTCSISSEQVVTLVTRAMIDAGLDASGERRPIGPMEKSMTVQGFSTAPPRTVKRLPHSPAEARPDWAGKTLSKTAEAAAPASEDPVERKSLAIKAATLEARRQLWLEIEKLAMPGGQSVGEMLRARMDGRLVEEIDAAIFVMSKPTTNEQGTARITLGVSLQTVWETLRQ